MNNDEAQIWEAYESMPRAYYSDPSGSIADDSVVGKIPFSATLVRSYAKRYSVDPEKVKSAVAKYFSMLNKSENKCDLLDRICKTEL